jgi:hypothetical protein
MRIHNRQLSCLIRLWSDRRLHRVSALAYLNSELDLAIQNDVFYHAQPLILRFSIPSRIHGPCRQPFTMLEMDHKVRLARRDVPKRRRPSRSSRERPLD